MKKSHNQLNDFPKEQVRSAIQHGIAQAEAQISNTMNSEHSYKVKNGKRKILYAICSVAAVFGILVCSSYYSPALASSLSKIPIIGSVFGDSNLIGLQQAQKNGLTSEIGETQEINGISVTLDEILYDQNNITIGYIIESEKELGEFYFNAGADFTINGELPNGSSGGYSEDIQSPTTRTAIQDITVTEDMPNAFELGLILHGVNGETWYFSTSIKQITDIRKVPIQHSENVDGINLTVTELSISETGVSISYESSEEGTDFELSRAGDIEFLMVDQAGNEITSHSGGVTGKRLKNRLVFKSNKQFDPINSNVTDLTITPYLALPTGGGGVEFDENGEPRELEFKGDSLQPVVFESFKVKITQ
ncbi:DUF4179 domain-containing protein [Psychrobacillus sp. OK032]|uniref:DUF4179 domain-containing protein n=1 Tax=Psychrobacillus sp. OK032 TaxID=1884358 RepID=UPI0008BB0906|nr:DUF4179 domain-containing protein [Psychrobacillus sp. OK032]SES45512.1 protein of unknown function [Psychrobacillus sp. OK032]